MKAFRINNASSQPKYKQIVHYIESLITSKHLVKGDKLPSLNEIKETQKVSRDTVLTAFNELKNKGIIQSVVGKGYYVLSDHLKPLKKMFLLFDEMNAFKENLYNSIVENLNEDIQVEIYFHHFNEMIFKRLIDDANDDYSYYVIMSGGIKNAHIYINSLPKEKVFMLDQINEHFSDFKSVYQDFELDIYNGLLSCLNDLEKYHQLNLVLSKKQPLGFKNGFEKFCNLHGFANQILNELIINEIEEHHVYVVFEDSDLIKLIRSARSKNWQSGKDFGLISYNETPLKDVIENGITTLSTDFYDMGKVLAEMITTNTNHQIKNRFQVYKRNSL